MIGLPDAERGERACAVVVLREGATPMFNIKVVVDHCRAAGLSVQKIPEQVEIVDALPRNASGKVLKYQLQETYAT